MDSVSRTELAQRLEMSAERVTQLTAAGIIKKTGGGYDILAAALAYNAYLRKNEGSRLARERYWNAQAIEREITNIRRLGMLTTHIELHELCGLIFDEAWQAAQSASSRYFSECMKTQDEQTSLTLAAQFLEPMQATLSGWKSGIDAYVARFSEAHQTNPVRIEAVLNGIRCSIDESLRAPNAAVTKVSKQPRKRAKAARK